MTTTTTTTNTTRTTTNTVTIRRTGLTLGWYDLSVAGLVLLSAVGACCQLLGA